MAKSKKFTQYSFINVVIMLNGRALEGFWEGDNVIEIAPHSPVSNPMVGADNATVVSVTADQAAEAIVRVQPNSEAHEYLNEQLLEMKEGNITPFSLSVRDVRNGEGGSSSQVTISQESTKMFGTNAAVREWRLFCANWQWNTQAYQEVIA